MKLSGSDVRFHPLTRDSMKRAHDLSLVMTQISATWQLWLACLYLAYALLPPAYAENSPDTQEVRWHSATHIGFGVSAPSNLHAQSRTGSVLFLDLKGQNQQLLQWGLRTTAIGSQNHSSEFYRLASGPLVEIQMSSNWSLQSALGWFRESGVAHGTNHPYQSQGWTWMAGWQRTWIQRERWRLSSGGFIGQHQGTAEISPASAAKISISDNLKGIRPTENQSWWRGFDIALHVSL